MRLKELTHQCMSVRVDVLKVVGADGWQKEPLAERLHLVLAVGQDVRVLRLMDLAGSGTGSRLPKTYHLMLDGILASHSQIISTH
jgi:hypothetical protein